MRFRVALLPAAGTVVWLSMSLPLLSCAAEETESTVCDQAIAKAESCDFPVEADGDINCSGELECALRCMLDYTCNEIKSNDPAYQACVDGCSGG